MKYGIRKLVLRSHFLNGNTDFEVYIGGFYFSARAYSLFLWKQILLQLNKATYSIGIIGAGNMAWTLAHRFIEAGCKLEFSELEEDVLITSETEADEE